MRTKTPGRSYRGRERASARTPKDCAGGGLGTVADMRWRRGRGSQYIEDRRGQGFGTGGFGAGGLTLPRVGTGVGGVLVLVLVIVLFASGVLGGGSNASGPSLSGAPDPDADLVQFVGFVVEDVQNWWAADFRQDGRTFQTTKL